MDPNSNPDTPLGLAIHAYQQKYERDDHLGLHALVAEASAIGVEAFRQVDMPAFFQTDGIGIWWNAMAQVTADTNMTEPYPMRGWLIRLPEACDVIFGTEESVENHVWLSIRDEIAAIAERARAIEIPEPDVVAPGGAEHGDPYVFTPQHVDEYANASDLGKLRALKRRVSGWGNDTFLIDNISTLVHRWHTVTQLARQAALTARPASPEDDTRLFIMALPIAGTLVFMAPSAAGYELWQRVRPNFEWAAGEARYLNVTVPEAD